MVRPAAKPRFAAGLLPSVSVGAGRPRRKGIQPDRMLPPGEAQPGLLMAGENVLWNRASWGSRRATCRCAPRFSRAVGPSAVRCFPQGLQKRRERGKIWGESVRRAAVPATGRTGADGSAPDCDERRNRPCTRFADAYRRHAGGDTRGFPVPIEYKRRNRHDSHGAL